MFASNITSFIDARRDQNEADSISRNPHMNRSNAVANRQAAYIANLPVQMGGHIANNRHDISQISYNNFGTIIN